MGFISKLRLVKDTSQPIERRVGALCGALTYFHFGYRASVSMLKERFGIELGKPVTSESLSQVAAFLETERREWLEIREKLQARHRRLVRLGLPPSSENVLTTRRKAPRRRS